MIKLSRGLKIDTWDDMEPNIWASRNMPVREFEAQVWDAFILVYNFCSNTIAERD